MRSLFLVAISLLSSWAHAARGVPRSLLVGIEHSLPATYAQLFEHKDKASNEYVVVAHQATMDLVYMATEAGKSGQVLQKFRYLRLTNHLFPHRGDVSSSFQAAGKDLAAHLNRVSSCGEGFETALTELKLSMPAQLQTVNPSKCEASQTSVRDIAPEVLEKEKEISWESETAYRELAKKIEIGTLSATEKQRAFTGYLSFESLNIIRSRDHSLTVEFELTRKHQSLSAKSLSELGPLALEVKIFTTDKVIIFPVKLSTSDPAGFDIWLRTFNLFLHSQYPVREVAYKNAQTPITFESKDVKISLARDVASDRISNRWVFENLPADVFQKVKKVVVR